MGKSELLTILAGIALTILIALVTIPSFTKGSDVAKISLINSDLSSIRKAGEMYIQSKSTTGDFTGISPEQVKQFIPSLKLDGNLFISSANKNITYNIGTNVDKDKLIVTIKGINVIKDAKSKVNETQSKIGKITLDTDVPVEDNGTLVISFNG